MEGTTVISRSSLAFAVFLGALLLISRADADPFSGAGFVRATLVVKIKSNKHKHDSDGDHHRNKKGDDQSDESGPESDDGSKDANASNQSSTPNAATTNQNVLWGDYLYVPPKQ
jgi:hypothetical protein